MDILTYALAKSYTDKALLGVGTIKGAPCTVKSQTEDDEYVYVTLGWENSLGTSEETVVKIKKGADGAPGEPGPAGDPGPQGISITKIEKKYYRQERKNKVKRKNDAGVWNRSFVKQNWKRGL